MIESTNNIRLGELKDVPSIAALLSDMAEVKTPQDLETFIKFLIANIYSPQFCFAVAEVKRKKKEKIVGVCIVTLRDNLLNVKGAFGNYLFIDPAFRKEELGRNLVRFLAKILKEKGVSKVYCTTSISRYFRLLGFKKVQDLLVKNLEEED